MTPQNRMLEGKNRVLVGIENRQDVIYERSLLAGLCSMAKHAVGAGFVSWHRQPLLLSNNTCPRLILG